MKFVGWIYDNDICPWTKVFDVDVEANARFGNTPFESLASHLVQCDLNGISSAAGTYDLYFIDSMFEVFGCNLKSSYYEKSKVLFDGKPLFKEMGGNELTIQPLRYHDKSVQCTIIDGQYIYFNMSSYGFWKSIESFICKTFGRNNLGGDLLKLGQYPEIDKMFNEIL